LHAGLGERLREAGLSFDSASWFASPRRLAVLVYALSEQAPDRIPGSPGAAAGTGPGRQRQLDTGSGGFCGPLNKVTADELQIIDTPKGQRLGLQQLIPGARTARVPPRAGQRRGGIAADSQAYALGRLRMEFARPVHWVVLMYGEETGFGKVLGIESGSVSRGHRFHAPQEISLKRPEDYVEQLRQARVITDFHERCGIGFANRLRPQRRANWAPQHW
jgi:glycyl-tRNA synthetase beta chain